jgi:hypothetical protein
LTAEDAFANASEPYFAVELLEAAQQQAPPPSPAQKGDRYLKAWDIGRRDASVCVVLRAAAPEEAQLWHVVGYRRLLGQDYPAIQREIKAMHREYPGPTVIEANSIGLPLIQNLRLPERELIEHTTTQASKQAMLTEIELLLQKQTLKIHPDFQQLLAELADYRLPDDSLTQDSVMALGFAVANGEHAHARASGGRINRKLLYELNDLGPPPEWYDRPKFATSPPDSSPAAARRTRSMAASANRTKPRFTKCPACLRKAGRRTTPRSSTSSACRRTPSKRPPEAHGGALA